MDGRCQAVKFLYRNKKNANEIFKLLEPKVSRSSVFKIIKRFKQSGSFLPKARSTLARQVKTSTFMKKYRGQA